MRAAAPSLVSGSPVQHRYRRLSLAPSSDRNIMQRDFGSIDTNPTTNNCFYSSVMGCKIRVRVKPRRLGRVAVTENMVSMPTPSLRHPWAVTSDDLWRPPAALATLPRPSRTRNGITATSASRRIPPPTSQRTQPMANVTVDRRSRGLQSGSRRTPEPSQTHIASSSSETGLRLGLPPWASRPVLDEPSENERLTSHFSY